MGYILQLLQKPKNTVKKTLLIHNVKIQLNLQTSVKALY